jgi:hypothetical protein
MNLAGDVGFRLLRSYPICGAKIFTPGADTIARSSLIAIALTPLMFAAVSSTGLSSNREPIDPLREIVEKTGRRLEHRR